jgi:uncharacterized protein
MSITEAPADPTQHPALLRFAASVRALYGDRVERIVLFGSRARGDAREDSDWDVAVFLRGSPRWWDEQRRLNRLGDDILWETGAIISPKPFIGNDEDEAGLLGVIRSEGREI